MKKVRGGGLTKKEQKKVASNWEKLKMKSKKMKMVVVMVVVSSRYLS